jgi:hypothetical protein
MQLSPSMPTAQRASSDGGGSFAEISLFFKEQREAAKAERAELEARLDAKDVKMEQLRRETETLREETFAQLKEERAAVEAKAEQQRQDAHLAALLARLVVMRAAKLLTDDEHDRAEDIVIDCLELLSKAPTTPATDGVVEKAVTMVVLSEKIVVDGLLARQLRRKVL